MTTELNLEITQGDTFVRVIRWETAPYVYKAITGISQAAPMIVTAVAHGLTNGWRAAVVSVGGMRQVNAKHAPPRSSEFHKVTVIDVDHVAFNDINSAEFDAYTSGGYLQYFTPVDLTGYTARMTIKNRVGGTVLATLASPADLVLDTVNKTITLTITAAATAAYAWTRGTYDLELVSFAQVVSKLYRGSISIQKEVTT